MTKIFFHSQHDRSRTLLFYVMVAVVVLFLQSCFCVSLHKNTSRPGHPAAVKYNYEAQGPATAFDNNTNPVNQ